MLWATGRKDLTPIPTQAAVAHLPRILCIQLVYITTPGTLFLKNSCGKVQSKIDMKKPVLFFA